MQARSRARQGPKETKDEKESRLAEEQRRLEGLKAELEKELEEVERTAIIRKDNLQRQIKRVQQQIEAVGRQRAEHKGFATTLEY